MNSIETAMTKSFCLESHEFIACWWFFNGSAGLKFFLFDLPWETGLSMFDCEIPVRSDSIGVVHDLFGFSYIINLYSDKNKISTQSSW